MIMANEDLAIKFTDNDYLTRNEVARALGTNLIDSIWKSILSYREQFALKLDLKDVVGKDLKITLTNSVNEKTAALENSLSRAVSRFDEVANGSIEKDNLKLELLKIELRSVAEFRGIIINDIALENIINGTNNNPLYQPISNYLNCLNKFMDNPNVEVGEDTLADYLSIIQGGGELNEFYRMSDFSSSSQRVLINREYIAAPVDSIEPLMNSLFAFINESNFNLAIKLDVIHYMFNYIKPFSKYNEELAILIMKHALVKAGLDENSVFIPLEYFLSNDRNQLINVNKESQKSCDLTYYINKANNILEKASYCVLDKIVQFNKKEAENAFFSDEAETIEEVDKKIEEQKNNDILVNIDDEEDSPKEEKQPKKVDDSFMNNEPAINVNAFKDLNEKQLKAAQTDLLESDPQLRPSQAHFYVRHCTLGKYYTIQQFKKAEGCVYETARTSMDNLARRGYYRREQIKNKFVYTPISKEK